MTKYTRTAAEKGSAPLSARVTDPKTLSAIDFIDANATRNFNMSDVMRRAVEAAAAELGWVYAPTTDDEI